jgi:hypothetical protein
VGLSASGASLIEAGADSTSYAAHSPNTAPWGFADSAEPLESAERMWQEALRLGPTDLSAVRPLPSSLSAALAAARDDSYQPESVVQ